MSSTESASQNFETPQHSALHILAGHGRGMTAAFARELFTRDSLDAGYSSNRDDDQFKRSLRVNNPCSAIEMSAAQLLNPKAESRVHLSCDQGLQKLMPYSDVVKL